VSKLAAPVLVLPDTHHPSRNADDFGFTVERPAHSQKVDLCNASFWSKGYAMCISETEWLFDRLKLAELTGSKDCVSIHNWP
jgi:hypothetical protein